MEIDKCTCIICQYHLKWTSSFEELKNRINDYESRVPLWKELKAKIVDKPSKSEDLDKRV